LLHIIGWSKHLYVDDDGHFPMLATGWEKSLLEHADASV